MPAKKSMDLADPKFQAEFEAMRVRRDRVSESMGKLLLRGYTMLADACPECQVKAGVFS
jgi:hypothetical protein